MNRQDSDPLFVVASNMAEAGNRALRASQGICETNRLGCTNSRRGWQVQLKIIRERTHIEKLKKYKNKRTSAAAKGDPEDENSWFYMARFRGVISHQGLRSRASFRSVGSLQGMTQRDQLYFYCLFFFTALETRTNRMNRMNRMNLNG